jgi:tetratricopeptide (TPR) repeat protein
MTHSGSIQHFLPDTDAKFKDIEIDEQAAIEAYDYEKAKFLAAAQTNLQNANVEDATHHYEQQLEEYNARLAQLLHDRKATNEQAYQDECAAAKDRLQRRVEELTLLQEGELRALEARWKEARQREHNQIQKTIDTLLSSSQLLAKSHRFQEAIAMRDKARALQKRVRHPGIEAVDADYQEQFGQTLRRHSEAFDELISHHEAFVKLLQERRDAADRTAEADSNVGAAYGSVEVMGVALSDTKNREVTIPVLRRFSPRKMRNDPIGQLQDDPAFEGEEEERRDEA